jgi:hypothetical protein
MQNFIYITEHLWSYCYTYTLKRGVTILSSQYCCVRPATLRAVYNSVHELSVRLWCEQDQCVSCVLYD